MARYIDADEFGTWLANEYFTFGRIKEIPPVITAVHRFPQADVAPVIHSRWIAVNNPNFSPFDNSCEFIYLCNNCGSGNGISKDSNYCPVCGAKMDEEVE